MGKDELAKELADARAENLVLQQQHQEVVVKSVAEVEVARKVGDDYKARWQQEQQQQQQQGLELQRLKDQHLSATRAEVSELQASQGHLTRQVEELALETDGLVHEGEQAAALATARAADIERLEAELQAQRTELGSSTSDSQGLQTALHVVRCPARGCRAQGAAHRGLSPARSL